MTTATTTTAAIKAPRVTVPAAIIAENHRKAFRAAFEAAFTGTKLRFVSPIVRNSICRGWFQGEEARRQWNKYTGPQFYPTANA